MWKRIGAIGTGMIATGAIWRGNDLNDDYMNVLRVGRTLATFTQIAFMYKMDRWTTSNTNVDKSHISNLHNEGAKLVVELCKKNGGVFIKIGQHSASLKGVIPKEYIKELRTLQDKAPVRTHNQVLQVLREELGNDFVDNVLKTLDPQPIGCASLAQVHRAIIHSNDEVALKVQHFDLCKVIESDIALVEALDKTAQLLFPEYGLSWVLRDFEANLRRELDFCEEAESSEKCRKLFESDPSFACKVKIPRVYKEYSSGRIICMELIKDAIPIYEVEKLQRQKLNCTKIANNLVEIFGAMMFRWGFVHCDPHPGNLLVCAGDAKCPERIAVLDHGLYRQLDEAFRYHHCLLWQGMILQDELKTVTACKGMGMGNLATVMPFFLVNRSMGCRSRLGRSSDDISQKDRRAVLKKLGLSNLTGAHLGNYGAALPADMVFLLKTMHLIKDLNDHLGGTDAQRFMTYARFAVENGDHHSQKISNELRWWYFLTRFRVQETWTWVKLCFTSGLFGAAPSKGTDGATSFSVSSVLAENNA